MTAAAPSAVPIPMLLYCPACGAQHVDAPEPETGWTNPPHKSHQCHACGMIWRPADVPTTGVERLVTRGSADTWGADAPTPAIARAIIDRELAGAHAEIIRLTALLNTPETQDFLAAVAREAAHQVERWGTDHDAAKEPEDWFWLLGYLAGKALAAARVGDHDKALHHTISSAAALANWHAHLLTGTTRMQPGSADAAKVGASLDG